jgi:hypothetical protein
MFTVVFHFHIGARVMANIGSPLREIEVEPLQIPVPEREQPESIPQIPQEQPEIEEPVLV